MFADYLTGFYSMLKNFSKSNCPNSLLFKEKCRDCILPHDVKRRNTAISIEQTTFFEEKERKEEREGRLGEREGRERTEKVNVPKVWDLLP